MKRPNTRTAKMPGPAPQGAAQNSATPRAARKQPVVSFAKGVFYRLVRPPVQSTVGPCRLVRFSISMEE